MRLTKYCLFVSIIINGLVFYNEGVDAQKIEKPNVIIILADDMGIDDVSFRGSNRFLTPNIDALAYSGIILNNLYTAPMCTPSRSALLTGKYPIHTGMQHYVIVNDEPWGLPENETTIAEIFQKDGYSTSLIGKWHQGMFRKAYTPNQRGFDQFFGYLGAYIDYYDHTLFMENKNYSRGHDLRFNYESAHFHSHYATDLFTEKAVEIISSPTAKEKPLFMILSHLAPHTGNDENPLQAPESEKFNFEYIKDENHRTYAAMMSVLDKSVGKIVEALSERDMLDNTIILFLSDNGAPTEGLHSNTGSNYPLRGQKNSPWEGSIRTSGAIWCKEFENLGSVWNQRVYIGDLLNTLAAAAFINIPTSLGNTLDSLNLWFALKYGYDNVEREIVHNIDEVFDYVSYMKGKWKFINGTTSNGTYDYWLGLREPMKNNHDIDPRSNYYTEIIQNTSVWQVLNTYTGDNTNKHIENLRAKASIKCMLDDPVNGVGCNPLQAPCLFDLDEDPCEQNNLYEKMKTSQTVEDILQRIDFHRKNARTPNNVPADTQSNPKNYDYEWIWWKDVSDGEGNSATTFSVDGNQFRFLISFILLLILF